MSMIITSTAYRLGTRTQGTHALASFYPRRGPSEVTPRPAMTPVRLLSGLGQGDGAIALMAPQSWKPIPGADVPSYDTPGQFMLMTPTDPTPGAVSEPSYKINPVTNPYCQGNDAQGNPLECNVPGFFNNDVPGQKPAVPMIPNTHAPAAHPIVSGPYFMVNPAQQPVVNPATASAMQTHDGTTLVTGGTTNTGAAAAASVNAAAAPAAAPSSWGDITAWLSESTLIPSVPNWLLATGVGILALTLYGKAGRH